MSDLARFASKVTIDPATGCWVWQRGLRRGYGNFWFEGKSVAAHVWASFVRDSYYDNATSALLDARRALTAAAEPTDGEDDNAAK